MLRDIRQNLNRLIIKKVLSYILNFNSTELISRLEYIVDTNTVWSLEYTIYYLSTIKREEEKKKAINNYLMKYIGASLALLSLLSRIQDIYI